MGGIAEGALTSLTFCWKLERSDGAGVAMMSSDREVTLAGTRYRSTPGITPASIKTSLGLDPDSGEVSGALSADALTQQDLAQGRWNGARVRLLAADWTEPEAETVPLLGGELGEISIDGDAFAAELRGAAARLANAPCPSTSPECRAVFGDRQCRVDLAGRAIRAMVVDGSENLLELDQLVDGRFLFVDCGFLVAGPADLQARFWA